MAIAAAGLFAGCSKKDNDRPVISEVLSLNDITTKELASRAELSGTLTAGSIGVFGFRTSPAHYQSNKQYTYGSPAWTSSDAIQLTDVGLSVYAYYPYTAAVAGTNDAPTLGIADNTTAQTDYLYSGVLAGSYTKTTNTVTTLTLKHALAKVVFTKAVQADYPGAGVISSITLKNAPGKTGLAAAGTMDIKTGTITATAAQATTYSALSGNTNSFKDGVVSGSTMVLPTPINTAGDIYAEVTLDGTSYDLDIPAGNWVKGTVNTYTLTISASTLIIQSVEIENWTTGENETIPIE